MPLTLLPFQSPAVDKTLAAIDKSPILVSPTGSGKTVMACEIMSRLEGPGLFCAHRKELVMQAKARLKSHGIDDVGIIMAGYPQTKNRIQVASVQTLARRRIPDVKWVIIDECHHSVSDSYQFALGIPRIGLTATPFRLDGKGLGENGMFGEIVVAIYADELFPDGTLIKPRIFSTEKIDLSKIKIVAGDYHPGQLSQKMMSSTLVGDIVMHWKSHAIGRRTIAFATSVAHSKMIVDQFLLSGVPAAHVDGTTTDDERDRIFEDLSTGKILVVSNCNIATEGVDIPSLECLIIARPTQSLCLHIQMFGRVMRRFAGKTDAIVLDHAGNVVNFAEAGFGLPWSRLIYSLDSKVKPALGAPEIGLKLCTSCYALVPVQCRACPECGELFPTPESKPAHDGNLVEIDTSDEPPSSWITSSEITSSEIQIQQRRHHWKRLLSENATICAAIIAYKKAYDSLPDEDEKTIKEAIYNDSLRIAQERGYKLGWADNQYRFIFDRWPRGQWVGPARVRFGFPISHAT